MKRTLLLTHEYYPYHGGIANYCYGLFSHLPEQNYSVAHDMEDKNSKVSAKGRSASGGKRSKAEVQNYQIKLIGTFWRPRWLTGYRHVKQLCAKEKIEIIFTPHIFPLGLIAEKIYRKKKIPYVLSLHGLDINLALQKDKTVAIRLLQNAQHVIVNSATTQAIVAPHVNAERLTILTPYFDNQMKADDSAVGVIKQRYEGKHIILSTGRLVKRKNHAAIIKAINALGRDDVHYCIIGDGPERNNLQQLTSELNLQQQVTFLTDIPDDQLPNYYAAADIFIMPTLNLGPDIEGYGIVYLEAAHFKKPIIASLGTSAEEILQHEKNGLLIDGTSLEAITVNLRYLLDEPAVRLQLGQAAYDTVRALPDWNAKTQLLNAILT